MIKGVDGNDIKLLISRPKGYNLARPAVVHFHGGGMAALSATEGMFTNWRNTLATTGMVVVGVEFRNSAGELGPHPFPAGLNDCLAGVEWLYNNKAKFNISKIITSGESGGGNLSLATCLKAKKENKLHLIQGVYACCPFIAGPSHYWNKSYTSMHENDNYFVGVKYNIVAPLPIAHKIMCSCCRSIFWR